MVLQRYGVTAGGEAFASSVASAMEGVLVSNHIVDGVVFKPFACR